MQKAIDFYHLLKNVSKNLCNKYSQKLCAGAKKSTADAVKTATKRAVQKTAEATGDLIGNKIADSFQRHFHGIISLTEIKVPKEIYIYIYIYIQKKYKKLLRLI